MVSPLSSCFFLGRPAFIAGPVHLSRIDTTPPFKLRPRTTRDRNPRANSSRLNGSMVLFRRIDSLLVPGVAAPLLACALVLAAAALPSPARAQGTHLWSQSTLDEFEKGTPSGVALESDGH